MSTNDIEWEDDVTFSPLAWEVARQAVLDRTDGGGICAEIALRGGAWVVRGFGATSTEAIRDLAVELDKWSQTQR